MAAEQRIRFESFLEASRVSVRTNQLFPSPGFFKVVT